MGCNQGKLTKNRHITVSRIDYKPFNAILTSDILGNDEKTADKSK